MSNDVAAMRIHYDHAQLRREDLAADPFDQFQQWLSDAKAADILEPNAMTLATSTNGIPAARMVLLKKLDHGFCFFTNYDSDKGKALDANLNAALVFYWDVLHRSVRIVGTVERTSADVSAAYYHSRPRGSRIGAWVSPQSSPIDNRAVLDDRLAQFEAQFDGVDEIPVPSNWGGYRVLPTHIEFWQGRPSRLHDRFRYTKTDSDWNITRLAP